MLLAIDIGNTNVALGLFDKGALRKDFRLETRASRTGDEYAALLAPLFQLGGIGFDAVTAAIVSSVVPPALLPIDRLCRRDRRGEPMVVGPGTRTGMPILYENPREVGADRIVNAVAAHHRWPG